MKRLLAAGIWVAVKSLLAAGPSADQDSALGNTALRDALALFRCRIRPCG